jgi:hypothetical protein
MPQFSLKRLFFSLALIAIGLGMFGCVIQIANPSLFTLFAVLFVGGTMIGGGVGVLFRQSILAALAAFLLMFVIFMVEILHPIRFR